MSQSDIGLTLIEVMVVMVILAVLAMVALPGYREHVRKVNRAVAGAALQKVALRQEQFFAEQRSYANGLEELGYPGDGFVLDRQGNVHQPSQAAGIYRISMVMTEDYYALSATPLRSDRRCGTLTLDGLGVKGAEGPGGMDVCW